MYLLLRQQSHFSGEALKARYMYLQLQNKKDQQLQASTDKIALPENCLKVSTSSLSDQHHIASLGEFMH